MFAGNGWNKNTFYPQYDIDVSYSAVFYYFSWGYSGLDLVARLNECGVKLDDSNGLGDSMFTYAWFTRVPKLRATSNNSLNGLYRGAGVLKTIEGLELPEINNLTWTNTFSKCPALQDIVITGMIANTVSFADCNKLTPDSVLGKEATEEQIEAGKNIFTHNDISYYGGIFGALKDLSDTTTTATLTLHSTVKTWLNSDYPGAIDLVRAKGWTVA